MEIKIEIYKTDSNKEPFTQWRKGLEFQTQGILSGRLARVRGGNLGACKPIAGHQGLYEIVVDYGPGYRIYYLMESPKLFIILWGGEKKSQKRDIEKAFRYLLNHAEGKS